MDLASELANRNNCDSRISGSLLRYAPALLISLLAVVLCIPVAHSQDAIATVTLNDGNCNGDPCSVTDPVNASAIYILRGVDHSRASANIADGTLRTRTESLDLDTLVPDAFTFFGISANQMRLLSPGGNLPDLNVSDRIAISGFAAVGNNGKFDVVAEDVANENYLLQRPNNGTLIGPLESNVEITVALDEESRPRAAAQTEGVVLTYTDSNPFDIGAGRIGMAFEVDYLRAAIPSDGTGFSVDHEMRVLFFARFFDASVGTTTNLIGGVGHFVEIDQDGEEERLLAGPRIEMQFVEEERTSSRFRGRVESVNPIVLEAGDTLTIVNAFFSVASSGDLSGEDEGAPLFPIAVSDGSSTATIYADLPPTIESNTIVPINWPTEPPSEDETIEVSIDIKPGETPNCININDKGVIPVAILGSSEFDASQIDTTSLSFSGLSVRVRGNGLPSCSLNDVNGDGFPDTECRFEDDAEEWLEGESDATVSGMLFDGTEFTGTDSVCIVPPK